MDEQLRKIAESTSYMNPSRYISGRIIEYDIKSANITMLRKYHMIDDNYYNFLYQLPKIDREKDIGRLIRTDKKYFDVIKEGIKNAKLQLFETNQLQLYEIVRIANDAVYVNRSYDLAYTVFDDVIFKAKSISSVVLKLGNLIIFFHIEQENINLIVKGISEDLQLLHSDYMLSFIGYTIYLVERVGLNDAIQYVSSFYKDYVQLNLPKEYYRELNSTSLYSYKIGQTEFKSSYNGPTNLDIGYNQYIIRELWSILIERFRISMKR